MKLLKLLSPKNKFVKRMNTKWVNEWEKKSKSETLTDTYNPLETSWGKKAVTNDMVRDPAKVPGNAMALG